MADQSKLSGYIIVWSALSCLTLRQGQQGDSSAQTPTTQTDQVGALCLELQPLSGLDQVQRGALQRKSDSGWSVCLGIWTCDAYYHLILLFRIMGFIWLLWNIAEYAKFYNYLILAELAFLF